MRCPRRNVFGNQRFCQLAQFDLVVEGASIPAKLVQRPKMAVTASTEVDETVTEYDAVTLLRTTLGVQTV